MSDNGIKPGQRYDMKDQFGNTVEYCTVMEVDHKAGLAKVFLPRNPQRTRHSEIGTYELRSWRKTNAIWLTKR